MYEKIIKEQKKALGVFFKAVKSLEQVSKSIQNMKDANSTIMAEARKEIEERHTFIEGKATANSMLQVDLEKNNKTIEKISEIISVR